MNKATKLVREHKYTYEQVEADLADFHLREKELSRLYTLLGISKKPQENDYTYLEKWASLGMEDGGRHRLCGIPRKGSLATLDSSSRNCMRKIARTEHEAREYLARRKEKRIPSSSSHANSA